MTGNQELALCYMPEKGQKTRKQKGVLVRLGIRIRNIEPGQSGMTVGALAGLPGYPDTPEDSAETDMAAGGTTAAKNAAGRAGAEAAETALRIPEEMLILCNFSEARLDRLLRELRKANAPVALKAVLTETNAGWSLEQLYRELCRERDFHANS